MQKVTVPWANWYGNEEHSLWFPDGWEVSVADMAGAEALNSEEIERAIETPMGSETLKELARGKKTVAIIVDDISRPTPASVILKPLIIILEEAGIARENISIFISLGAHRPMKRDDIVKKIGEDIVKSVPVLNHSPFEGVVLLGKSKNGTPIIVNRLFMEMELKIAVGCILPHSMAGFGGGAKGIIPGLGGIDTLLANHSFGHYDADGKKYLHRHVGNPDNQLRLDMEDITREIGLDFIVNAVFNSQLQVAGLFAGDMVKAHREGCAFAKKVYHTSIIPEADVVILNAYPKDTEFVQVANSFNVGGLNPEKLIRGRKSTIVLTSACSEGAGFHALMGPGMRLFAPFEDKIPPRALAGAKTWLYSPNLSQAEIYPFFESSTLPLYNEWEKLIEDLVPLHQSRAKVAVYPLGSIQMGE